jgi:hypothetical protein
VRAKVDLMLNHILLVICDNDKAQAKFVEKWLAANQTYSAYKWPPTKVYFQGEYYRPYHKDPITDFADMCAYIKHDRERYKQGGKTPLQCHDELSRDLQALFNYIYPTQSDIAIFMNLFKELNGFPDCKIIAHNSDATYGEDMLPHVPKNVISLWCQNYNYIDNDVVKSLPIGL